ncbi:MAG: hypothetical protein C0405_06565 [Desulfovibrio sp.]|nr:hypothetical protein [Desulfovibrio sp.]
MFTPLETALITFASALVVGILVRFVTSQKFVTCDDCEKHRGTFQEELEAVAGKDKADHGMMLRMLRSIVVHLNIPREKQEEILNDRGGK